jgi:hypothetical protein
MLKTQVAKITLHRGSGRRLKRYKTINGDALFWAVACVIFSRKMALICGGEHRYWMTKVGEATAKMVLNNSQEDIGNWLFDNLLSETGQK